MQFEKQQYQSDCVNHIVNILEDIPLRDADFSLLASSINQHYQSQKLSRFDKSEKPRIDIIMETGTGKTFTYIQTIFEINKRYGHNKFIIVVPRRAIKLGVIQNIKLTKSYFYNEYGKYLDYIDYHAKGGNQKSELTSFTKYDDLKVLIITNSAFNSPKNIINQNSHETALVAGHTLWQDVASKKPIVIMDEPHLLKGHKTTQYLDQLKQSLFIRFGATFPTEEKHKLSNVAYCLDSVNAFNQYLVKKIRVHTLLNSDEETALKITKTYGKDKFDVIYARNNQLYKTTLSKDEDIGTKTKLTNYTGITATKITANEVYFSNKTSQKIKQDYKLSTAEKRGLIKASIRDHFEKEEELFKKGIKTLSLFFIDAINQFKGEDAEVKNIFEQEYKIIREEFYNKTQNQAYKDYLNRDYRDGKLRVHGGYFSGDKGTKDEIEAAAVDTILNDKEKLLSFDEPLRFIFSVWALQEGWDNPNIMNICKLAPSDKETSRRQQVGRGLRIAVNQQGKRQTFKHLDEDENQFYNINSLDVFVSGKEKDFISAIQKEINEASFSFAGDSLSIALLKSKGLNEREASRLCNHLEDKAIVKYNEDMGEYKILSPIAEYLKTHKDELSFIPTEERYDFILQIFAQQSIAPENVNNAPNPTNVSIKASQLNAFKQLWESINKKSAIIYKDIEEDYLISTIAEKFNDENIDPIKMRIITQEYDSQNDIIIEKKQENMGDIHFFQSASYQDFIHKFIKDEKLPMNFVIKLFNQLDFQKIKNNPKKAQSRLKNLIKEVIHQNIQQKISYEFSPQTKITSLQDANGEYLQEIKHTLLGRHVGEKGQSPENFLYDTIIWDSAIEKTAIEKTPQMLEQNHITVFAKLPKIDIPTPYKSYNPDFAYLLQNAQGQQLFLVVETKGYESESLIPTEEQQKIAYAEIFFKELQKQLPNVKIEYKKQVNKQSLMDIVQNIEGFKP